MNDWLECLYHKTQGETKSIYWCTGKMTEKAHAGGCNKNKNTVNFK